MRMRVASGRNTDGTDVQYVLKHVNSRRHIEGLREAKKLHTGAHKFLPAKKFTRNREEINFLPQRNLRAPVYKFMRNRM